MEGDEVSKVVTKKKKSVDQVTERGTAQDTNLCCLYSNLYTLQFVDSSHSPRQSTIM